MKSVRYNYMHNMRAGEAGNIARSSSCDNEISNLFLLFFFFLFFLTILKESGYYNDYVESSAESSERYHLLSFLL